MAASIANLVPDDGLTHEPAFHYMIELKHTEEARYLRALVLSVAVAAAFFLCCLMRAAHTPTALLQQTRYAPPEAVAVVVRKHEYESNDESSSD